MFDSPGALTVVLSAVAAVAVIAAAAVGSLLLGPNARRNRAFARARLLLSQGQWQQSLHAVRAMRQPGLSAEWQGKLNNLEGECHLAAGEAALKERHYEAGLAEFDRAAHLLLLNAEEFRSRVVETMLAEVRKLYAEESPESLRLALDVAGRASGLTASPEASFWRGMCLIRTGEEDEAALALAEAHQTGEQKYLDPPLYLGALRLRQGQPQEALRYLSEANRADSSCPVVPWQLGLALVAAGGDGKMALQALARALGPRGLGMWIKPSANGSASSAQRLWAEGMPENRSFVRRLAQQHHYVCPLLGDDLKAMVRQGQMAMAQAHQRLNNFQAAADIYTQLLQDNPPTFGLLRGLGLALARLERYDLAFKHLRVALDMEPRDQVTAGYLALCGAMGKPTSAEDKARNVLWAVRLLARFKPKADPEWARMVGLVLAEARGSGVALTADELVPLCEALAGAGAADANAAIGYDWLAGVAPGSLRPVHGWLFARAAQQHGVAGDHDLDLFALAYADLDGLGAFYTERDWDLAEMEYCYLERTAQKRPGRFPESLGPDYPSRGTEFLSERSYRLENSGKPDEAMMAAVVLALLAPDDADAHHRLASLSHARGDLEQSVMHLEECCRLRPSDHRSLLRLAVVLQQRGQADARRSVVRRALKLAQGPEVVKTALLGARLAVKSGSSDDLVEAADLLEVGLRNDPQHPEATWQLAAVRCRLGDRSALVALSPKMDRPGLPNPRFQHLAAVCHLAAGNASAALAAAHNAAVDDTLADDSRYLAGVAAARQGDPTAAALLRAAAESNAASADRARALLGRVEFQQGHFDQAVAAWSALPPDKRMTWHLDEPLKATAFLAAVASFRDGRFARAAQQFREAGKLGCRDRRLGQLLQRSLFEAGRQLLFPSAGPAADKTTMHAPAEDDGIPTVLPLDPEADAAAEYLEQALKAGCSDPDAPYLQGVAHRRAERFGEARASFRKAPKPESRVFLQLGLLSLQEAQVAQAEQEFARARELDPSCYASCHNLLLTRLSLGQLDTAEQLIAPACDLAPADEEKHFLTVLGTLLRWHGSAPGDKSIVDPVLAHISDHDEQRLLKLIRGLGNVETSLTLLKTLMAARRKSQAVQDAFFEAVLVRGKSQVDRGSWGEAERLLGPWASRRTLPREYLRSLRNLLGCAATMNQDFSGGLRHFQAAVALDDPPGDPRLPHNIALAMELLDTPGPAEQQWSRCFDLLEIQANDPRPNPVTPVARRMLFFGLVRLMNRHLDKERWQAALPFAERAQRVRPDQADHLEKLLQIYQHLHRQEGAKWALARLRALKPDDAMYELYEIDLKPVANVKDAEEVLADVARVAQKYAADARVEERARAMAVGLMPILTRRYESLSDGVERVKRHVRNRTSRSVDWDWVDDETADLKRELVRLRRVVVQCDAMVKQPEHRRLPQDLISRIDRKMSLCDSLAD